MPQNIHIQRFSGIINNIDHLIGVSFNNHAQKYVAQYKHRNKTTYIGLFVNPIDAAIAYDKAKLQAAKEGKFGDNPIITLNFGNPDLPESAEFIEQIRSRLHLEVLGKILTPIKVPKRKAKELESSLDNAIESAKKRAKLNSRIISKFKGVSFHSERQRWKASLQYKKNKKFVGSYSTEQEAAAAYLLKYRELAAEYPDDQNLQFRLTKVEHTHGECLDALDLTVKNNLITKISAMDLNPLNSSSSKQKNLAFNKKSHNDHFFDLPILENDDLNSLFIEDNSLSIIEDNLILNEQLAQLAVSTSQANQQPNPQEKELDIFASEFDFLDNLEDASLVMAISQTCEEHLNKQEITANQTNYSQKDEQLLDSLLSFDENEKLLPQPILFSLQNNPTPIISNSNVLSLSASTAKTLLFSYRINAGSGDQQLTSQQVFNTPCVLPLGLSLDIASMQEIFNAHSNLHRI